MAKLIRFLFFAFLTGVTIFSVFKYLAAVKERYDLLESIKSIRQQVALLEAEKKDLQQGLDKERTLKNQALRDNSSLKESLRLGEEKLARMAQELSEAQRNLEELSSQISIVTAENTALKEDFAQLNLRLEEESRQKEELAAKLNSISELKKAIRELKRRMRTAKAAHQGLRSVASKKPSYEAEEKVIEGNYGYIIRDGKPTSSTKVRIEVLTLP